MRKRNQDRGIALRSFIEALAIGLAPVFAVIPVLMLIVNGDVLGPWWIPLLMLYIMLFYVGEIFLIGHKYRNEVHMQVGHEAFYEIFPKERRRALRRVRKNPNPERESVLESYRMRLCDADEDEKKAHNTRISNCFYYAAAAIIFALAGYCVYGLYQDAAVGMKMDAAHVLRFLAVVMMLTVAIAALRRSKRYILQTIASVLLFLNIWANFANKVMMPQDYTWVPVFEGLIVLAIFLIAAFGLMIPARMFKSDLPTRREKQAFALDMYELGVIDEKELAYRMEK